MSRNLLFISKYPEIIKEFTAAMQDKNIDIDTAQNGYDAVRLLKKKQYQVVVSGLIMDGFNGEQIITYINQTYPNTVCIIYATAINAAQLQFYMNKRDVFRVFLRPVNFRMEFFQALEEAFEYYAIRVMDQEEVTERRRKFEEYQKKLIELQRNAKQQKRMKVKMGQYMKRMVAFSVNEYEENLTEEGKKKLKNYEIGIIELCCGDKGGTAESMKKAEAAVSHIESLLK